MKTVLVAGGAGLVGSAVAEELLRRDHRVVVADVFGEWGEGRAVRSQRTARLRQLLGAIVVPADLTDPARLDAVFEEHSPSEVVNAAVFPPDGPGAGPLLEAIRAHGVPYLVHLADGTLYGPAPEPGRPAREDEPLLAGSDPAEAARIADEERVRASGLPHVILRIFNVLSPGASPGRFPAGELELLLSGEAVPLPPDEPEDFVDVFDVVRGVVLALEKKPSGVINLGGGRGVSRAEVLSTLASRAFRPLRTRPVPLQGERRPRIADLERAVSLLSYYPQRSLAASAASIVAARLLPPPEEVVTSRPSGAGNRPAFPGRVSTPRSEPREVTRRDLFGIFRRPFDRS